MVKAKNLRGQLYQHKDGSSMQQTNEYDFKGNPLETQQQLLDDATLTDADWSGTPPALSTEVFTSSLTYDALNRPITTTDAGGNVQAYTYDKGGLLKSVELNSTIYVQDIHYDAKGQRQAIWYGNGTKTSYTYDPDTFRLRRLLTVNVDSLSPHYNEVLQDLHYWYDPVGNITRIQDDAQQTLFFNNSVVAPTQKFTYDALYRLIEARGRELIGTATFGASDNWNDSAWQTSHKGNGNAVQNYTQHYTYDEVGNILELQHVATAGSYTRTYDVDTVSNRLLSTTVGVNTYSYTHDTRGNMLSMPHLQNMAWNASNELHSITQGTTVANYQYSGGQRVRKWVDKGSNIEEERIYLGGYEIYRKYISGVLDIERTTVHVSDDTGRIAMLEERTQGTDPSPASLERYNYSNHLQSATLELDGDAEIISYEEYHPYGTTSYQASNASINAVAKRYRYTGKERDEESGLYYHGARYYIPWLARWTACDPLESKYAGLSPYNYCVNNPVKYIDDDGREIVIARLGESANVSLQQLVDLMNTAIGGVKVFGVNNIMGNNETIKVGEYANLNLNTQQKAFVDLINEMSKSSRKYYLNLDNHYGDTKNISEPADVYNQTFYVQSMNEIKNNGKYNLLYVLFHEFGEQKQFQELMLKELHTNYPKEKSRRENKQQLMLDDWYNVSHENTLNKALEIFGYRYYTQSSTEHSDFVQIDLFNGKSKYLTTVTLYSENGVWNKVEGEGKDMYGNKLSNYENLNPNWRNNLTVEQNNQLRKNFFNELRQK
ncbi:RHS repeat domain-containing protein [Sphingobacterium humi]|nr:RHS repeat-associated core domain-containing protein [Sphingobacterium humi]